MNNLRSLSSIFGIFLIFLLIPNNPAVPLEQKTLFYSQASGREMGIKVSKYLEVAPTPSSVPSPGNIPDKKIIKKVFQINSIPLFWGANHAGGLIPYDINESYKYIINKPDEGYQLIHKGGRTLISLSKKNADGNLIFQINGKDFIASDGAIIYLCLPADPYPYCLDYAPSINRFLNGKDLNFQHEIYVYVLEGGAIQIEEKQYGWCIPEVGKVYGYSFDNGPVFYWGDFGQNKIICPRLETGTSFSEHPLPETITASIYPNIITFQKLDWKNQHYPIDDLSKNYSQYKEILNLSRGDDFYQTDEGSYFIFKGKVIFIGKGKKTSDGFVNFYISTGVLNKDLKIDLKNEVKIRIKEGTYLGFDNTEFMGFSFPWGIYTNSFDFFACRIYPSDRACYQPKPNIRISIKRSGNIIIPTSLRPNWCVQKRYTLRGYEFPDGKRYLWGETIDKKVNCPTIEIIK